MPLEMILEPTPTTFLSVLIDKITVYEVILPWSWLATSGTLTILECWKLTSSGIVQPANKSFRVATLCLTYNYATLVTFCITHQHDTRIIHMRMRIWAWWQIVNADVDIKYKLMWVTKSSECSADAKTNTDTRPINPLILKRSDPTRT